MRIGIGKAWQADELADGSKGRLRNEVQLVIDVAIFDKTNLDG